MKKKKIKQKLELTKNTISHLEHIKGGLPYTDPRVAACFSYHTNCSLDIDKDVTFNIDCTYSNNP